MTATVPEEVEASPRPDGVPQRPERPPPVLRLLRAAGWPALALIALAFFLPGFFDVPPFDRDEARFAQASKQMLESGDFVDIRFQEHPRHKKPIGVYWLQAGSAALFGGPQAEIWAYRLPSLLGAIAAVLLTAWTGRRLFGPDVGWLGAVMLASCVLLGVEARMAKTDAVLLATIVLAQGALARIYLAALRDEALPPWPALLFWAAQGLGILVKGPIILLVSGTTLLALAVGERRVAWMARLRPLLGLPVMAAIALPWLIAITLATDGAFFQASVGHDMLGKLFSGQESHGAPPGTYLLSFWGTFWPFSLIAGLAAPWVWRNRREPAVRFCLAWLVPTWIVFELVVTKLPHYVLPVFPAIALLTARAALASLEDGRLAPRHWASWIPFALFALVGVLLAAVVPAGAWYLVGGPVVWAFLGGAAALAAAALGFRLARQGRTAPLLTVLPLCALGLYVTVWQGVIPRLDPLWISREAAAAVATHRPCPETRVASAGYSEPSLVFLVRTDLRLGGGGAAAQHLLDDPDCALALVTERAHPDFEPVLAAAGRSAETLVELKGFNYSRGRPLALRLYRLTPRANRDEGQQ